MKARTEMRADGLFATDVVEAILNAQAISKVIRSRSIRRQSAHEKLYVIKSHNYSGTLLYTKGKIDRRGQIEVFYVFISAKVPTLGN
jgi:hypothetical protein